MAEAAAEMPMIKSPAVKLVHPEVLPWAIEEVETLMRLVPNDTELLSPTPV